MSIEPWFRNNISQHNSFEFHDKEPYSDDTAIQTYIDIQFNPVKEQPVPVPVEVPTIIGPWNLLTST